MYGAYLAYADHEIRRVVQAVENFGELDNTLIIYIGGDNGASAESRLNGTPNEFTIQRRASAGKRPTPLVSALGFRTDVSSLTILEATGSRHRRKSTGLSKRQSKA